MENSQGLEHSLVLFWTKSKRKFDRGREYYELKIDVNKYHIIGCDDHERTQLLLYRSRFVGSNIRSYLNDTACKGVIDRLFKKCSPSPEMSPDISFYSEDEYPHRDFALSCGVRSSFCFPFDVSDKLSVMEIVSTCNQDVATLKNFCESFKGFDCSLSFQDIDVQKHSVPEIDHLLEAVSQKFQLPLTQYWKCEGWLPYLVGQCSYGVLENLAPWCQFKDACFHKGLDEGEGPLGSSCKEPGNFFCRDITALSITRYPFVHYARNCGSISCFTMYLHNIFRQYEEWILEFFLPAQEMDNDYPETLLNSLWATIKERLPNWISVSRGLWGQVLSVKVIKSSSHNEPESLELGQHYSLPHLEGSDYIRILNLFANYTGQRSNSYSSEEAAAGKTSKRAPTEAFQPRTSEEHFEIRGNTVAAERGNSYGDPEILNSVCSGHLLVLFWTTKFMIDNKRRGCFERAIDLNQYHIIGCDDDDRTKLLLYRSHFLRSNIRSYLDDTSGGVIDRVVEYEKSEMSPDISFYSEDEYPNRDFALSCGIRSSFCFPSTGSAKFRVVEIVSTCNQDLQTLKKFCQSIEGFDLSSSFSNINVQKDAVTEIKHLLEVVSQTFHLPLTQYWNCEDGLPYLVQQFSHTVFENLAPWCQFKDACFHKALCEGEGPLGSSCEEPGAFFCKDITAPSITQYPFAHYARNCGSISCFTIYLRSLSRPYEEWILEFFLPAQEMDDDYPQTLLNSIWATIKDCLPNCELASGEQLGQVLSVEVVNSSNHNEPESFKIGHSSPHLEGSGYTHTSNLFESGTGQRSNSYSYEEAATGETSKRVPIEAFQPITSEEHYKIRGTTLAAERVDEPVEESSIEDTPHATSDVDVGCAASNIDIRNAMTTAAQPFRFETMKKTTQQEEETMILEYEGDASIQLPRISQPLFECATEQVKQVLNMKKSTPNMNSDEEIPTGALSKTPEDVEQIISLDELEECIEPQSLTTQPRRSKKIFRDEGYTVASEKVDNQVKVSPDEDVESAVNIASKRLKPSKIPFTLENVRKHAGRPLKDAAESFGVSPSTFKRRCRSLGITWWPLGKKKLIDAEKGKQSVSLSMRPLQDTPVISHRSQPLEKMTVKATYNGFTIKFGITNLSGVSEIEDNVIKRLHLEKNNFSIKYQDNDNELILIGCDEDVQECMKFSRSAEKTTIMMLIHPPVNHSAT